ncbi:terminase small subunit [Enterococcus rotai]|uniref:terminase small subunit n=1 Tax=Enterococcus rotai TaxID=118060 RepID=UPI0035C6C930
MTAKGMNNRQKIFVTEYLIDFNATQAAIRAGYSEKTARSQGQRLLTNVDIKNAIKEEREKIQDENIATAKDVEEFLSQAMNGQIDEEVLMVVGAGDGVGDVARERKELSAKDRIKAAELLGKRHALFTDRQEIDATVRTDKLDSILQQLGDEDD